MEQLVEHSDSVYEQTVSVALELEDIKKRLVEIEKEEYRKLEELRIVKSKLHDITKNEKVLSTRNIVMREKITELEEQAKEESQDIGKEMKTFFKKLGLKVQFERKDDLPANLCELRIQFLENKSFTAIFVYDSVTEDYDRKLPLSFCFAHFTRQFYFKSTSFIRNIPNSMSSDKCFEKRRTFKDFCTTTVKWSANYQHPTKRTEMCSPAIFH